MGIAVMVDVHSHIVPDAYMRVVIEAAERSGEFAGLAVRNRLLPKVGPPVITPELGDIDLRLQDMESAGITRSVLSVPPPGPAIGDPTTRAKAVANTNDELISIADQYAERFRVMASLPFPDVGASLTELERVSVHPLVGGIELMTVSQEWTVDLPDLLELYSAVAERGLVLFLHPALEPMGRAYEDFGLTGVLAPVVSSSLGALRLVLSGMLDRVATLDVVVPHLGGTLPYLCQRVVDLAEQGSAEHPFNYYLSERLYLDTVSFHPPAFVCALRTTPPTRILLGSDAPFRGSLRRAVEEVKGSSLSAEDQGKVLGKNATRWFA